MKNGKPDERVTYRMILSSCYILKCIAEGGVSNAHAVYGGVVMNRLRDLIVYTQAKLDQLISFSTRMKNIDTRTMAWMSLALSRISSNESDILSRVKSLSAHPSIRAHIILSYQVSSLDGIVSHGIEHFREVVRSLCTDDDFIQNVFTEMTSLVRHNTDRRPSW
jgi:hypothetical protein